ncbi:YicC family protein [bacterium]|nr:YicC family protein [candidate division CSSED10-310 bacterium]
MAHSMTGIGESRITRESFDVHVLIRSVNHRFLNIQVRTPHGFQRYETIIREIVSGRCHRGKIDVYLNLYELPAAFGEVVLNRGLCRNYHRMAEDIAGMLGIPSGMTAAKLLSFNDMVTTVTPSSGDEALTSLIEETVYQAVDHLDRMRRDEGMRLGVEMQARLVEIAGLVEQLATDAMEQPVMIRDRLTHALRSLATGVEIDPARLDQEVMMHAMRADVTEEITRLRVHCDRMAVLLAAERPVGKEAEFLLQELHREINTIGSKSAVSEMSRKVIAMKLEIEKLREQVQNLE